ncbi:MAG: hypothetical protein CMQ75_01905 [Gammaproteobacteria bacterium]|nr:hypothetical protein [Gammaproteobacteria bacterium]RPG99548.1 MAG: tail fiber domain-containing protein [Candidatus Pelagibacter sp. TMED118]|tara:strand:- start:2632 stop:4737 length:2106 start_codon:yes stop_codon:yes gene_type:complete
MAIITINAGGRPMTVDVPDFAMESTQQDVRAIMSDMQSSLTGLRTAFGTKSRGEADVERAINDLNATTKKNQKGFSDSQFAKNLGNASAAGVIQGLGKPQAMSSFMRTLGLGSLATGLGLVEGLAGELAQTFSFARDVGITFGDSFIKTQQKLSYVGLNLDQFGDIVAQNLPTMRELGKNTEEGSQNFIKALTKFVEGTNEFGNFGLKSDEMAQLLAEELEIKRRTMSADELQLHIQDDLNKSMIANIREQERMSKITGDSVRERIAAQMRMRNDIRVQAAMMGMNDQQRQAITGVASNLTEQLGPAGKAIGDAIAQGIAVEGTEMTTAGGQMAALDSSGNIMRIIQEGIAAIKAGGDPDQINQRIAQLIQDFKREGDTQTFLTAGTMGGNKAMMDLLTMQIQTNEVQGDIAKRRTELMNAENEMRQKHLDNMTKFIQVQERKIATQEIKVREAIIAMTGVQVDEDFVGDRIAQQMLSFSQTQIDVLNNQFTTALFQAMGNIFGGLTIRPLVNAVDADINGDGEITEKERLQQISSQAYLGGQVMQAMNLNPTLANALMAPQLAMTGASGINTILQQTIGQDARYRKPDGTLDIEKFLQDKGSQTVAIAQDTLNSLADKIANALNNIISSDIRLKTNIEKLDKVEDLQLYTWNYTNGIKGKWKGVMAQDLLNTKYADAVILDNNYYKVDYSKLPVDCIQIS